MKQYNTVPSDTCICAACRQSFIPTTTVPQRQKRSEVLCDQCARTQHQRAFALAQLEYTIEQHYLNWSRVWQNDLPDLSASELLHRIGTELEARYADLHQEGAKQ